LIQAVLGQIAARASLQGLFPGFVQFVGQQSKNGGVGVDSPNLLNRFDPGAEREVQVHDCYVWLTLAEKFNSVFSVRRCGNQFHVRLELNQKRKTFAQQWIMIHYQDANLACFHSFDLRNIELIWKRRKAGAPSPLISGVLFNRTIRFVFCLRHSRIARKAIQG